MKKLTTTLLSIALCMQLQAQITLTEADFPKVNDYTTLGAKTYKINEIPLNIFALLDTSKATFNIDLSGLDLDSTFIDSFYPPEDLEGGDEISTAEMGYKSSGVNVFFRTNNKRLEMVGVGIEDDRLPTSVGLVFDKPLAFSIAPLTYPSFYSDSTTSKKPFAFGTIELDVATKYSVNGYGTITLPDTSFEVLRIKRTYDLDFSIVTFFGTQTENRIINLWEFYTNGVPNSVARIEGRYERDVQGNIIDSFMVFSAYKKSEISTNIPTAKNNLIVNSTVIHGILYLKTHEETQVAIYDLSGRLLYQKLTPEGNFKIENLPKGVVILKVQNSKGTSTQEKIWMR